MEDREQFYNEFFKALENVMESSGVRLEETEVPKNNRIVKGITAHFPDIEIAPTVYPDHYFGVWKNGYSMESIASSVKNELLANAPGISQVDIENMNQVEATTHLRASIVNYENNKEWLKDIPHERLADLAVFAKWDFGNSYTAKVNDYLLGQIGLTKEEVLKLAKRNTGNSAELKSMNQVMIEIIKDNVDDESLAEDLAAGLKDSPLYVLTTESGLDGASLIADKKVLAQVHEELGEDFYILPSSIHELILVGKSEVGGDVGSLREMVRNVNEQEVSIEERLSDNVYEFNGTSLTLAGADELKEEHNIADTFCHHHRR